MNRKEATIALMSEFISEFNEATAVTFNNQSSFWFCTSPRTATTKPSSSPWVVFSVEHNITSKSTLGIKGHRRFRRAGFVSAQIFIPENTGTDDGWDLCEEIISIFEGERIATDIVFTYGDPKLIGITDSGWYLFDTTIYFTFDEEK